MKKLCLFVGVIAIVFSLTGCQMFRNDKAEAQTVANTFLTNLYTVSKQDVNDFKDAYSLKSGSKIDSAKIEKLYEKFKSQMNDKDVKELIINSTYSNIVEYVDKNGFEIKKCDIALKLNTDNNNSDTVQYDYTVKLTVNQKSNQKIVSQSGLIQLLKENNDWKVNYIRKYNQLK